MHVDAGEVPKFVLPFGDGEGGSGSGPERSAPQPSADGALPFRSEPEAGGATRDDEEDAESLAGTVAVPAGMRLKAGKPRLSLEQFASLSAEIAVHPEQRAAIEQRYGLDAASHDREKGAWAVVFLDDEAQAKTYQDKLSAFRAWLERKGAGS